MIAGIQFPAQVRRELRLRRLEDPVGADGCARAPGSHAFSFVFQSFIDELAHAAEGSSAVPPRPAGEQGVSATRARGRRVQCGSHGRRREDDCREAWDKRTAASQGTGMGIGFQYSHRGYFAEVAEVSAGLEQAHQDQQGVGWRRHPGRQTSIMLPRTWCRAA